LVSNRLRKETYRSANPSGLNEIVTVYEDKQRPMNETDCERSISQNRELLYNELCQLHSFFDSRKNALDEMKADSSTDELHVVVKMIELVNYLRRLLSSPDIVYAYYNITSRFLIYQYFCLICFLTLCSVLN
jgi:hypothetical protein